MKKLTPIKDINRYVGIESKKLTSANSFFHDGVGFYIVKQDKNGKALKLFASYLYPSGYLITLDTDKDRLKKRLVEGMDSIQKFIEDNDIKV